MIVKRILAFAILLSFLIPATTAYATSPKTGSPCTPKGKVVVFAGKEYTCILKSKKLVWSAGIAVTPNYTITYMPNGGTGTMVNSVAPEGNTIQLIPNSFVNLYNTFTGWNTSADGSGITYQDGAITKMTQGLTLYAQWMHIHGNSAGYIYQSSSTLLKSSGQWTVLKVNCNASVDNSSLIEVGVGGFETGNDPFNAAKVGQFFGAGTANNCVNGLQNVAAFISLPQYLGANIVTLPSSIFPVGVGDVIETTLNFDGAEGRWRATINDLATGNQFIFVVGVGFAVVKTLSPSTVVSPLQTYGTSWTYNGGTTSEWLVVNGSSSSQNFGSVAFSNLSTSYSAFNL